MVEPYFDDTLRDGRRQSNPLLDPSSHVVRAPNIQLWKNAIADDAALAADGSLASVGRASGMNFADYESGVIQVVPRSAAGASAPAGGTSNPILKLLEWNAGRDRFVDTGVTLTAGGAGINRSWSIDTRGRILYVHMTGVTASQSVSLYSQGSNEITR